MALITTGTPEELPWIRHEGGVGTEIQLPGWARTNIAPVPSAPQGAPSDPIWGPRVRPDQPVNCSGMILLSFRGHGPGHSLQDGKGRPLMDQVPTLIPWEQLYSHVQLAQLWGGFPLPAPLSHPRSCPSTRGVAEGHDHHLQGRKSTPAAAPPAWPCLHPTAPSGTGRHSSQLDLPGGKQVPHGLFPVSSRGAARSASSIPGKQQHRGHCATGASLAAGMCPQGLQVLSGHWAVPQSRATLRPGHSR